MYTRTWESGSLLKAATVNFLWTIYFKFEQYSPTAFAPFDVLADVFGLHLWMSWSTSVIISFPIDLSANLRWSSCWASCGLWRQKRSPGLSTAAHTRSNIRIKILLLQIRLRKCKSKVKPARDIILPNKFNLLLLIFWMDSKRSVFSYL